MESVGPVFERVGIEKMLEGFMVGLIRLDTKMDDNP